MGNEAVLTLSINTKGNFMLKNEVNYSLKLIWSSLQGYSFIRCNYATK